MTPKVIKSHAQDNFMRICPEVKTRHVKVTLCFVGWFVCVFVSGLEAHSAPSQTARSLKPIEAMDSGKLQQLQELMREARETGELESSLAAASVFPVPKRSNRKNVPLAEHNRAIAGMAKPAAGTPPIAKSTLLANVPASSNAPPMTQGPIPEMMVQPPTKPVSTAMTNPETSQGINRMRLAHERGDSIPSASEVDMRKAKAVIFHSNPLGVLDQQAKSKAMGAPGDKPELAWQPGPGHRPVGYVKDDSNGGNKRNKVTRQPIQLSLHAAIPEAEEEDEQVPKQLPIQTQGSMSDASKRQRSPGASMFQEHLDEFDGGEWEAIELEQDDGHVVYSPVLDPMAGSAGVGPGPFPSSAPEDERVRMANSHCPTDVLSYSEWGRTMIQFGTTMRGESYYMVAHGAEERYVYYRKWARSHLERKSVLGRDFVKYLAVKERYFGTVEDDVFYRAEATAKAKAKAKAAAGPAQVPLIPGSRTRRQYLDPYEYSLMDDPWNE